MPKYLFMSAEVENEEETGRDHSSVALRVANFMEWLPEVHKNLNSAIEGFGDSWNGRVSIRLRDKDVDLSNEFTEDEYFVVREGLNTEWCDAETWTDVWLHFHRDGYMQITGFFGGTGTGMYTPFFTLDHFKEKQNV